MNIPVAHILPIDDLSEYKIHFAVWNGEQQPLDVFVRDPEEWKGWNSWRGRRDDFIDDILAGRVVDLPNDGQALLHPVHVAGLADPLRAQHEVDHSD